MTAPRCASAQAGIWAGLIVIWNDNAAPQVDFNIVNGQYIARLILHKFSERRLVFSGF